MFMARSRSRVLAGASPSLEKRRSRSGDAQADLAGDESLPVFEPARVVTDEVGVGVASGGGVE